VLPAFTPPTSRATVSSMDPATTALERAFQLARSGDYASVPDIKKQLTTEGYAVTQVTGGTLTKQLLGLIREARAQRAGPSP
jgi:hypothetical protein